MNIVPWGRKLFLLIVTENVAYLELRLRHYKYFIIREEGYKKDKEVLSSVWSIFVVVIAKFVQTITELADNGTRCRRFTY